MSIPESIALVDLSSISVRCFKARSTDLKLTPQQVAAYTVASVMQELTAIRNSVHRVILCADRPPYWRLKEYPAYKGTRPAQEEELKVVKRLIFERIRADGLVLVGVETFEADDVIATLAKQYEAMGVQDIRICGCDKDLAQCVTEKVRVFSPTIKGRGAEIWDPAEVHKKFGVWPQQMPLYQALVGDDGDNIPGVEKCGAVTASSWIRDHKSLMGLGLQMAKETEKGPKMGATWKNFAAAWEHMPLWIMMTTLRTDVPIDGAALLPKLEAPEGAVSARISEAIDLLTVAVAQKTIEDIVTGPDWDAIAEAEEKRMREAVHANDDNGERLAKALGQQPVVPRGLIRAHKEINDLMLEEEPTVSPRYEELPPRKVIPPLSPDKRAAATAAGAEQFPKGSVKEAEAQKRIAEGNSKEKASALLLAAVAQKEQEMRDDVTGRIDFATDANGTAIGTVAPCNTEKESIFFPSKESAWVQDGLAVMRAPFPEHQISKLPKGTKAQNDCPPSDKRNCAVCGGWHHPKIVHLDYVGHAALTDRLLEADLGWSWEPMALTEDGLPRFDGSGGLWIRLTVCGVTRLGYGHAQAKGYMDVGAREKEVIGDALRNAAMRFGAALDLWFKGGDLHDKGQEP